MQFIKHSHSTTLTILTIWSITSGQEWRKYNKQLNAAERNVDLNEARHISASIRIIKSMHHQPSTSTSELAPQLQLRKTKQKKYNVNNNINKKGAQLKWVFDLLVIRCCERNFFGFELEYFLGDGVLHILLAVIESSHRMGLL